jgi:hypothetical protein
VKTKQLAKALRARQARLGMNPKKVLAGTSDEDLLRAYVECSRCREAIFADAKAAVRNATSVEEFLQLVNMGLAAHVCAKPPVQGYN